jgi:hypothetical protein
MRHVYYVQPDNDGRPVNCFLTEAEAIARAKAVAASVGFSYATDEAALADFMAVHWASFDPEDFIATALDGGAA